MWLTTHFYGQTFWMFIFAKYYLRVGTVYRPITWPCCFAHLVCALIKTTSLQLHSYTENNRHCFFVELRTVAACADLKQCTGAQNHDESPAIISRSSRQRLLVVVNVTFTRCFWYLSSCHLFCSRMLLGAKTLLGEWAISKSVAAFVLLLSGCQLLKHTKPENANKQPACK